MFDGFKVVMIGWSNNEVEGILEARQVLNMYVFDSACEFGVRIIDRSHLSYNSWQEWESKLDRSLLFLSVTKFPIPQKSDSEMK